MAGKCCGKALIGEGKVERSCAVSSYAKVKRRVEMFSKGKVKYRDVEYGNGLDKQSSAAVTYGKAERCAVLYW